jgi:hypothetical protein
MALRPWPAFKSFSPKLWCENAFSRHIYARKRDAFLYSAVLTMIIFIYPQKEWRSFYHFHLFFAGHSLATIKAQSTTTRRKSCTRQVSEEEGSGGLLLSIFFADNSTQFTTMSLPRQARDRQT